MAATDSDKSFLPPATDPRAERAEVPLSIHCGSVLAWLGILISFLLTAKEAALRAFLCPVQGGCESVLTSKYAELRGIPLPWLGVVFYATILSFWLAIQAIHSPRIRGWLFDGMLWILLAGLTFSVGLMYVQFVVLRAFCPLCTASALMVLGLLLTARRAGKVVEEGKAGASFPQAATVALFAVFPMAIWISTNFAAEKTAARIFLVDLSTAHRLGPPDAPVQLIVFSDFQCGFCRELAPVVSRLHAEFPQDLEIIYRHFPLGIHPRAMPAAVAAECAGEQGAFWPYHDELFAEGGTLEDSRLLEIAKSLGLDQSRFVACLNDGRARRAADENLREAMQFGLEGAPAVFLNGERVEDALTHDSLARRIKDLLRARSSEMLRAK